MTIPKEEQCAAILHATLSQLAGRYCAGDLRALCQTVDVTRLDLKDYLATHEHPKGWWWLKEETYDGLYLVPRGAKWYVYLQERGERYDVQTFTSRDDALDFVIDRFFLPQLELRASTIIAQDSGSRMEK